MATTDLFLLVNNHCPAASGASGPRERGSSLQALDLLLLLSHLQRDGAAGQRQSTAPWLGPSWCSGCLPGKNCSLSLLCSNWSFLTHLPEKPSPTSSASSRGQCLSTTGADPAAQRDSRGEKSHPRASPQQSCSLGAFCSRVDTETWVRLKSPHDRGTAAAPSSLAPIMGAEHCPLEMVTRKTSWETGSAWMSQLHPLLDLCWGWGRAGSGVSAHCTASSCPGCLELGVHRLTGTRTANLRRLVTRSSSLLLSPLLGVALVGDVGGMMAAGRLGR